MKFFHRIRTQFQKKELDQDLSEELAFHIEKETEENIAAGMSAEDARYAALRSFGGIEQAKEECRDAWGVRFIETLLQDIRFGLRQLRRNPGFTAVAVVTLALGIGANTAIFSVVNTVLLRPLAMEDPSRVVFIQEQWKGIFPGPSVGNFADIQRQSTSFTKLCASHDASFNLATSEAPERVQGEYATADYFATFGVQPIAGRVFTVDEDKPGHGQVVVISERFW